jgi:ABC-type Zn uptake system ZnuABC Zn-binding protein ZnuA
MTAASAPVQVVTTLSILADLITQVGGERVGVTNIIPAGSSAESYSPSPQDARTIAQAGVIFVNGHGLEAWLDKLLTSAARPGVPIVELSKELQAIDAGTGEFEQGNPHFWLDPHHAMRYVEVIRDTLAARDPQAAQIYQSNAAAYLDELRALDTELAQAASQIPAADRQMVTDHDAFPYFAQRYGFTLVGNLLGNAETDLSARDLAELMREVKEQRVKAIFSESQFNPTVAEAFARDAGVSVVATLYTDSLGTGGEAGTYIDMMRFNMRTIVEALTGEAK